MSLVSSSASKNKAGGSNGAYSDMYALHERGESQSEPEQGMTLFSKVERPIPGNDDDSGCTDVYRKMG